VFEHNLSAKIVEAVKTESLALAIEVATVMCTALPMLTQERCL